MLFRGAQRIYANFEGESNRHQVIFSTKAETIPLWKFLTIAPFLLSTAIALGDTEGRSIAVDSAGEKA